MPRLIDLTGHRFGMLTVLKRADNIGKDTTWTCECDCGKIVNKKGTYLKNGDTKSCGCYKQQVDEINLCDKYDDKRVEGVVKPLFKGKTPRRDSTTGYRGVNRYYTRKSKEVRYRAWITVNGEKKYKGGFLTPEQAYYEGRLWLEEQYLPREQNENDQNALKEQSNAE